MSGGLRPDRRRNDPEAKDGSPLAQRCQVAIVGAGMVGLTLALELTLRGITVQVIEQRDTRCEGSRSICQAKRTLEIWDRLGAATPMLEKGVSWNTGKVFHRDRLLYAFDLLPEPGYRMPAFVNLQQYYVEEYLAGRLREAGGEVHWRHACVDVQPHANGATLEVEGPAGRRRIECDWLVACDGARSSVRRILGVNPVGEAFADRFLISDVHMSASFPSERWFWFEPPFHPGQTALLHRQADDVWRIDLQLGPDADAGLEREPGRVRARLQAMLGADVEFEVVWTSVYVFQCRTLERYVHGHVIFAGDAAHQVSPFGARGGNGGVQDVDNLAWKLAAVLQGRAPASLLGSYDVERRAAAAENILNSTRATDFIAPRTPAAREWRDTVLGLAARYAFARPLVNAGRLSLPASYAESPLNTADTDDFDGGVRPGTPALDAPVSHTHSPGWFLHALGPGFTVVTVGRDGAALSRASTSCGVDAKLVVIGPGGDVQDTDGRLAERYGLRDGTTYLFRPDQHVAARWRRFDTARIATAIEVAYGMRPGGPIDGVRA